MLPAGEGTTIDYDEVEKQITLIGRIAADIEFARSSLDAALDAQDAAAWTAEGAPAQVRRTLVNQAGYYRRHALDDLQAQLAEAAANLKKTIQDFQDQDAERAQRYLTAINGVLTGLPETSTPAPAGPAPAAPAPAASEGGSPWV